MWEQTITGDEKSKKEIKTVRELWRSVSETLKAMKAERKVACAATQMLAPEPLPDRPKNTTSGLFRFFGPSAVRGMSGTPKRTALEAKYSVLGGDGASELLETYPPLTDCKDAETSGNGAPLSPETVAEKQRPGEEKRLVALTPPWPTAPPLEVSSGASTPPQGDSKAQSMAETNELLKKVVQQLQDLAITAQRGGTEHLSGASGGSLPPCLPGPPATVQPRRWSEVARDAMLDGQWQVASSLGASAFPVLQENNGNKWAPHDWKILQQAKNTVSQYGIKSEATRQIVIWIFSADFMCPADCQNLMRLLLSPTQYLLWGSEWSRRAASAVANRVPVKTMTVAIPARLCNAHLAPAGFSARIATLHNDRDEQCFRLKN